jgi:TRAP transporter 4TM/12TM fusion protein
MSIGDEGKSEIKSKGRSWALTRGITIVGVVFSVYHILIILNVFERLGMYSVSAVSHRAISLCLILVLVLMLYPFRQNAAREKVPWWDWILIGLGVISCTYIVLYYELGWMDPRLHPLSSEVRNVLEVILGIIAILLVLDITRRVMGLALPLIAFCFVIYSLFSNYFPGILQARGYSLTRLIGHLYMWSEGIWGVAMGVSAITIVAFIIFSSFISESGAGNFFTEIAISILGRRRGGPAKAVIISDALFGMVSGSTTASIMTTGVFTIPMMKKVGYSPNFSGAVEAVAGNGAQVMPPVMGAVVFIICEFLSMPYREVVLKSVIPALLYWFVLYLTLDYHAVLKGFTGLPSSEIPSFRKTLREGWFFLVPILGLIFFLVILQYSPERSALFAVGVLFLISCFWKKYRMGPKEIIHALEFGARNITLVATACATAGVIIGCMSLTGLGAKISTILLVAAHDNLFLILFFSAIACYILGMGMSSIPVYLTVAITVAPALVKFGVAPLPAHLFVFWWALTSFTTPPVAIGAYAAAGIAGGDPFRTGYEGMRLGAGLYLLPFMFVFRPGLLLMDSVGGIILSTVICTGGIIALVAGLTGYFLKKASLWERILFSLGGIFVSFPGWLTTVGFILIAPPTLTHIIARLKAQKV